MEEAGWEMGAMRRGGESYQPLPDGVFFIFTNFLKLF